MKKVLSLTAISLAIALSSSAQAGFVIIKNGKVESSSKTSEIGTIYTSKKVVKPTKKLTFKESEEKSEAQISYEYQKFMQERSKHK